MAAQSQPPKRCRLDLKHSVLFDSSNDYNSADTDADEMLQHKSTDSVGVRKRRSNDSDCVELAGGCTRTENECTSRESTEITEGISTCPYTLETSEGNVSVHEVDEVDPDSLHKTSDIDEHLSNLCGVDSTNISSTEKSACVMTQDSQENCQNADVSKKQMTLSYFWTKGATTTCTSTKSAETKKKSCLKLAELDERGDGRNTLTYNDRLPEISDFSDESSIVSTEDDSCDLGIPVEDLPSNWISPRSLHPLKPSLNSTVLFSTEVLYKNLDTTPSPFPEQLVMDDVRWDDDFVRMPYAVQNKFVDAGKSIVPRWSIITASLENKKWSSSRDIEYAITRYNKHKWDFSGLHRYCDKMADLEQEQFFGQILPNVAKLALALPSLCTQPIPILCTQREASITMSQEQAACLLANAFFCTFPARSVMGSRSSSPLLPSINFNSLFRRAYGPYESSQHAKLDCLLNYFRRVTAQIPRGTLTYRRQVLSNNPDWANSDQKLTDLCVTAVGTIEDRADGMLHVDFANKVIGGGVLGEGCVQEEIRFVLCPEMIISRLFTEQLANNECLIITGAERFNNYSGYGRTFRWASDHRDVAPRDDWGRLVNEIVAIDAKVFSSLPPQLTAQNLCRELNKAYCGFFDGGNDSLCAVATGNWGCGAFGGDLRLKALLQLMAAAQARRAVCYFTFGDVTLSRDIYRVHEAARASNCTVGRLWKYIRSDAKSSSDIYRRIISDQHAEIIDTVPDSPCYEADTP